MLRLDFNLVLTMINLVVLYLILRKFLFRPLMNIMEQRRTMIADGLQHAEDTKKEAYALKSQYESALGGAKEESTRIIGQAKKDAKAEYDRILDEADQAAGKLMKDATERHAVRSCRSCSKCCKKNGKTAIWGGCRSGGI